MPVSSLPSCSSSQFSRRAAEKRATRARLYQARTACANLDGRRPMDTQLGYCFCSYVACCRSMYDFEVEQACPS